MSRIFYRLQMKAGSDGETITDRFLAINRITSDEDYAGEQFLNLRTGDIILIHKGAYPVCLVSIAHRVPENELSTDSFGVDYAVSILSYYKEVIIENPSLNTLWGSTPRTKTFSPIYSGNQTYSSISQWYNYIINRDSMIETINLLKYKHQIILQGPPGTGKTRLAKIIAEEMTKPKNVGSPKQKIDEFLKSFDGNTIEVKEKRKELFELLNEFHQLFPKEKLNKLTLEEYAFGQGDNDSFCYWLEYLLWELSIYSGYASKFLIYWKKDIGDYSKSGFLKNIENNEDAMEKLAKQLHNVANEKNLDEAENFLGKGFILKILCTYYPEKYFPINNEKYINNALKLLQFDGSKLSFIEKNKKLQELFLKLKKEWKANISNIEFGKFLFSNFDLKGKISLESNELIMTGDYKVVQFHPAYSYEDFVRGISAQTNINNQIEYEVENKILAEFAEKSLNQPLANFVLVIDEINRANLTSVLGELIYALEYRFDENNPKGTTVESMYELKGVDRVSSGGKSLKLPKNLYIIGTMNTADRSVGHIDYAIRRRFSFVNVLPKILPEFTEKAKALFNEVSKLFCEQFREDDISLENSKYLAPDFKPTDVILGHSYFLIKKEERETLNISDDEILKLKLEFEIKPILREYIKDGILSKEAESIIESM